LRAGSVIVSVCLHCCVSLCLRVYLCVGVSVCLSMCQNVFFSTESHVTLFDGYFLVKSVFGAVATLTFGPILSNFKWLAR